MCEDSLLCSRHRAFVPLTTLSDYAWSVVPNWVRRLRPIGPDPICVADITYIRLRESFMFLAVVSDEFSRKVMGWAMEMWLMSMRRCTMIETGGNLTGCRVPCASGLRH